MPRSVDRCFDCGTGNRARVALPGITPAWAGPSLDREGQWRTRCPVACWSRRRGERRKCSGIDAGVLSPAQRRRATRGGLERAGPGHTGPCSPAPWAALRLGRTRRS
eukprot:scaffold88869_cov72-Phaeocystis_antarctica.AAC.2